MRPTLTAVALVAALELLVIPGLGTPAWAQEGEDAESLIRQGVQLRRKGDNSKAHGYFKRAYEISHTPRATAQLGLVEQALDKLVEAESHLSEALSAGDAWVDEHREVLQNSVNVIRSVLGRIQVRSRMTVPHGAVFQIAPRPATRLPPDGVIWSYPGTQVLRVQSPGQVDITKQVIVTTGAIVVVDLEFLNHEPSPSEAGRSLTTSPISSEVPPPVGPSVPGQAQVPRDQGSPSSKSDWKGPAKWITGGAALLALGVGVTETLAFNSRVHAFNDTKDPTDPSGKRLLCSEDGGVISGGPTCTEINNAEAAALKWAVVGYSVGGALAVASTALFLMDRRPASEAVAFFCAPGGFDSARIVCQLRF